MAGNALTPVWHCVLPKQSVFAFGVSEGQEAGLINSETFVAKAVFFL